MSTQGENNKLAQNPELNTTRRHFVKGAAIAAPIIASVTARPVWAYSSSAVSGNLSGNLSQPTGLIYDGKSPGYWQGSSHDRISALNISASGGYITGETKFKVIFTQSLSPYSDMTFFEILHGGTNQPERFTAAAYFNAYSDVGYPLSTAEIIQLYNEYLVDPATSGPILHGVLKNLTHCGTEDGQRTC